MEFLDLQCDLDPLQNVMVSWSMFQTLHVSARWFLCNSADRQTGGGLNLKKVKLTFYTMDLERKSIILKTEMISWKSIR